jgi:hypothetical protein
MHMRAIFGADNVSSYALTYLGGTTGREITLALAGDDKLRPWIDGE